MTEIDPNDVRIKYVRGMLAEFGYHEPTDGNYGWYVLAFSMFRSELAWLLDMIEGRDSDDRYSHRQLLRIHLRQQIEAVKRELERMQPQVAIPGDQQKLGMQPRVAS